jgi:hypothetical protein
MDDGTRGSTIQGEVLIAGITVGVRVLVGLRSRSDRAIHSDAGDRSFRVSQIIRCA